MTVAGEEVPNVFICTKCPEVFKERSLLNKHTVEIHGNSSPCVAKNSEEIFVKASDWSTCTKSLDDSVKGSASNKHIIEDTSLEMPDSSTCSFCHKVFIRRCNLYKHIIKIHGHRQDRYKQSNKMASKIPDSLKCNLCNKEFPKKGYLFWHKVNKHAKKCKEIAIEKPFACSECCKAFKKKHALKRHLTNVHGYGSSFACRRCKNKFSSKLELMNHNKKCKVETRIASRACRICETHMLTKEAFLLHFQVSHPGIAPFKCSQCGEEFSKASDFNKHLCSKSNPIICDQCGEAMKTKTTLTDHMIRFHGLQPETFECTHCNKLFHKKHSLKLHLMNHGSFSPIICNVCGAQFSEEGNLKTHMRRHTKEKPYTCPQCFRKFPHSSGFLIHIRTHTGEKPFKCEFCGWQFADKHNLITHVRTHTGEKPYACDICNKTFAQLSALKQHSRRHLNPVCCD